MNEGSGVDKVGIADIDNVDFLQYLKIVVMNVLIEIGVGMRERRNCVTLRFLVE